MKKVTISDVANHANVSKSTVSQYLNKRYDYMGMETRERIENAIKELNFQPNIVARSLKLKSTSTIGVIVSNILHSFTTQIIRAIEDVCNENNFHVIVCNADDNPVKERNYIEMLQAKQVDGLILFPIGKNLQLYQQLHSSNFPLVFMERTVDGFLTDTILLDNHAAVSIAIQHFIDRGYERIALMTLTHNITSRFERLQGYKDALVSNGLPVNPSYIKSLEIQQIKHGLEELLSMGQPPQALLVGNDLTLMEVLQYVQEHRIRIPRDLALIAIDDVKFSTIINPPLTTISQPLAEMGKKAAELLLAKVMGKEVVEEPRIYRFEPTLNVRESC